MEEVRSDHGVERLVLSLFFSLPKEEALVLAFELETEDFNSVTNQVVFSVVNQLLTNGGSVDHVAVDTLARQANLIVPEHYVATIYETSNETNNSSKDFLVEQLKKYTIARKLSIAGEKLKSIDVDSDLTSMLELADQYVADAISSESLHKVEKLGGDDFESRIRELLNTPKEHLGIPTGMKFFDYSFDGVVPGRLTLIGARPGMGKSALGENFAYEFSIRRPNGCLLIDTETSKEFVENRLLSISAKVDFADLVHGKINADSIIEHVRFIQQGQLYYYYMPNLNVKELTLICRKYKKMYGISAVVVDFLGSAESENMYLEIGTKVKAMHDIATQLDLGFIVFQQLSREQVDKTSGKNVKEVSLAHFVQSDMSTWYPDSIAGIRTPTTTEKARYQCNRVIDVPKNRFGEAGLTWPMFFTGGTMRFEDVAQL